MSVLSFNLSIDGRQASIADTSDHDFAVHYVAITSNPVVSEMAVLLDIRCPQLFSTYVASDGLADAGAWCVGVDATQDSNDPTVWRVVAKYSNKINRPDLWEIRNPLLRPAVIEYDSEEVMVPMEYDGEGYPVRDTAEMRFDPPPEREEIWQVIRITKNLPTYDRQFWLSYCNAVNSSIWAGYPIGYVRCRRPKAVRMFENGVWFYQVGVEFVARPLPALRGTVVMIGAARDQTREPWDKVILNQGLYKRTRADLTFTSGTGGSGGPCPVGTDKTFYLNLAMVIGVLEPPCDVLEGRYEFAYDKPCEWVCVTGGSDSMQQARLYLDNLNLARLRFNPVGTTSEDALYLCDSDFTPSNGGLFKLQNDKQFGDDLHRCEWPETIRVHGLPAPGEGEEPEATDGRCGEDGFVRVPIVDERVAQVVTQPWPLDEFGDQLPLCADPVWLCFRYRPRKNFTLLNLGVV